MEWYNAKNLINGVSRMFGGTVSDADANPRGELIWCSIAAYFLGNSVGTNNTLKGNRRVHIGPLYVW